MVQLITRDGLYLVSEAGTKYDKPCLMVKLPHREGETWSEHAKGAVECRITKRAGPWEKVRVPAGEFTAARIADIALNTNRPIPDVVVEEGLLTAPQVADLLTTEALVGPREFTILTSSDNAIIRKNRVES